MKLNRIESTMVLLFLSMLAFGSVAGEKKKLTKEEEEEALRTEATSLVGTKGRETLAGQFAYLKDEVANGKPLPKVIGYVNGGGAAYPIMVSNQTLLARLKDYDRKDVTLMGKYLDKGEKGKWFVADEMPERPGGAVIRRKRGGL
jgi:hypothetical protein